MMNAALLLEALGRTSLWLASAAVAMALVLQVARPNWPTAHRAAWLAVLLIGWTFLRLPVTVPWYETARIEQGPDVSDNPVALPATPFDDAHAPHAARLSTNDSFQGNNEPPVTEPALKDRQTQALQPPIAAQPAARLAPAAWTFPWRKALAGAWVTGIGALLAMWLFEYGRFVRLLASRTVADETCQAEWRALLAATGVRRAIPLCVAGELGPMLCRLPRGYALIVPPRLWRDLEARERAAILRHELAHYQRGDVWKSLAARV